MHRSFTLGRRWLTAACAVVSVACGGASKSSGPHVSKACAPSGTVTLDALHGTTIDCSNGGDGFTLASGAATYLIVPEFATGNVPYQFESFDLGRMQSPAVQLSMRRSIPATVVMQSTASLFHHMPFSNRRQARFDLRLRAADRARLSSVTRSLSLAPGAHPPAVVSTRGAAPDSIRSFHVIADSLGSTFKTSVARLSYSGTYVYVYLDTASPKAPNGFTSAQLTQFGQYADQLLYPLDLSNFGPPTDVDNNSHVIMLLTPIVNSLTPKSECATEGYIAGFFNGLDLDARGDPNSNAGEIFYQVVPDSAGAFSCSHSVTSIEAVTPGTFLHELQHMINNGQHVLIHGGSPEEGWLDEGESIVATELGSRYYERKYPPPTGRSNVAQLFPDSAEPFIEEQISDSYNWLTDPDTASLTLHTDADCCLAWRAGDWMLLRYVGDQFDSTVYARLEQSNITGTANLAHAMGIPFAQMFANFGLALYVDSVPGVPRASVPSAYQFASRNFRAIYARLHTLDSTGSFPQVYPIAPQALSSSDVLSGSMVPGTVSFYQLTVPAGSGPVTVGFTPPGGGSAFPSTLQPQVAVFRIQ